MTLPRTMIDGWIDGIRHVLSPNHDCRPDGETVSLIVIHAISLPPSQFGSEDIIRLFTNTLDSEAHSYFSNIDTLRVSTHFLIRRSGEIIQFVSCDQRAWHAGVSCWNHRERCNDFSIGIELEGCDHLPFEDAQYTGLAALTKLLGCYYPIEAITGHSDIAPDRKTDPGPCFSWQRLSMEGLPPYSSLTL